MIGIIKVSRSIKELSIKIKELQKEEIKKSGNELSLQQISKQLNASKEDIIMAMEISTNTVESIEASVSSNDGKDNKKLNLIDKISTGKNEEEMITNKIIVEKLLNGLQEKEKEVIMLRFYKEKTQAQVGKILGITQVQVSRIEKKVLAKMKLKLTS